jgi:nucleotide-binding universal stress UspA family protein
LVAAIGKTFAANWFLPFLNNRELVMIAKLDQGVVIVPWDFSRVSRCGLDHALNMTNDSRRIHVVHVATPLSGPDNGVLYAAAEKRKCLELESCFRDQIADDAELNAVNFHVTYGYPGVEIARFADRHEAELIVVSSPEKRSFSDILFSGLANQVVSHARRPVLVVQVSEFAMSLQPRTQFFSATFNRIFGRNPNVVNVG